MSNVVVKLVPGNGYTEDDMQGAKVSICGLQTSSSINLSNGEITAKGNVAEITPRLENGVMRALVVPQSVSESNLVKIVIGDMTYLLKQSMTFVSGKQHTCTITVEKTSQGINIGIGGWDVDDEDFGGIVE